MKVIRLMLNTGLCLSGANARLRLMDKAVKINGQIIGFTDSEKLNDLDCEVKAGDIISIGRRSVTIEEKHLTN